NASVFIFLSKFLPGWGGMRVPTRSYFFTLIAMAVATVLALRVPRRRGSLQGAMIAAGTGLLLLPELFAVALPITSGFRPSPLEKRTALEQRIFEDPSVRALAILPLRGDLTELPRMWGALKHHRPIANGFSGALSPEFKALRSTCGFPRWRIRPQCVHAMTGLGISHFVVDIPPSIRGAPAEVQVRSVIRQDSLPFVNLSYADADSLLFELRTP
ncbi:MAG: hypothetical protein ABI639_16850, partial [Thermoanaerobaculia bacterium]